MLLFIALFLGSYLLSVGYIYINDTINR